MSHFKIKHIPTGKFLGPNKKKKVENNLFERGAVYMKDITKETVKQIYRNGLYIDGEHIKLNLDDIEIVKV